MGKVSQGFDELDLNGDGKITSKDIDLTDNGDIKNSIAIIHSITLKIVSKFAIISPF